MHSIYSKLFLLAGFVFCISASTGSAQRNASADTLHRLYVEHKSGDLHNYLFKEETTIERIHSDSSTRTMKREVLYYFSQVAPKSANDGFTSVTTTIDSMVYRFTEDGSTVEYNSMKDAKPNLQFLDLLYATVPLNRSFDMEISPYGDVAKVSGEMVEWLRNYTSVEGKDVLAPIQMFMWMDGISDNNLKHFGDITKGIIPNGTVKRDSVWNKGISLRMNNIDFSGLAKANITSARDGNIYTIQATADNLTAQPGETRLYGITEMLKLNSGKGQSTISIELNDGDVRKVQAQSSSILNATIQNETFNDKISTNLSWTLIGKNQW